VKVTKQALQSSGVKSIVIDVRVVLRSSNLMILILEGKGKCIYIDC